MNLPRARSPGGLPSGGGTWGVTSEGSTEDSFRTMKLELLVTFRAVIKGPGQTPPHRHDGASYDKLLHELTLGLCGNSDRAGC